MPVNKTTPNVLADGAYLDLYVPAATVPLYITTLNLIYKRND